MRTVTHAAASMILSTGTWILSGPAAAAGVLLGGTILDADHLGLYLDAGLPRTPKALFSLPFSSEGELQKKYSISRGVPRHWYFPGFHAVEWIALAAVAGLLLRSAFLLGAAAGMAVHVTMDLGNYPCSPRIWSILWRSRNRERLKKAWSTYVVTVRL